MARFALIGRETVLLKRILQCIAMCLIHLRDRLGTRVALTAPLQTSLPLRRSGRARRRPTPFPADRLPRAAQGGVPASKALRARSERDDARRRDPPDAPAPCRRGRERGRYSDCAARDLSAFLRCSQRLRRLFISQSKTRLFGVVFARQETNTLNKRTIATVAIRLWPDMSAERGRLLGTFQTRIREASKDEGDAGGHWPECAC